MKFSLLRWEGEEEKEQEKGFLAVEFSLLWEKGWLPVADS